ncbi:hypothetical protein CHUAL_006866 [Chamberlinius hualienensis]
MASNKIAIIVLIAFVMAVALTWTTDAAPSEELLQREKRWTCDIIGSSQLCALHCKGHGYYTGYCSRGICKCRRRNG